MEFTPGDRVELVATTDPYTRLRPGDRGTIAHITDYPPSRFSGMTAAPWPSSPTPVTASASSPTTPTRRPPLPASSLPTPEDPIQPRYPEIQVQLSGEDGNAFAILGRTAAALRQAGVPQEEIDAFFAEATSGDYDHLLQTTMRWVDWQ
jgi:hypothetical protein